MRDPPKGQAAAPRKLSGKKDRGRGTYRLLQNYLRCLAVVKSSLKMLIYSS